MKRRMLICSVSITALALRIFIVPVSAVILEVTVKGQVSTVNPVENMLYIKNPVQYGCDFPAGKDPICAWRPMETATLAGTVPDASAFQVFKGNEVVVATSTGGAGEQWITLAKLYGSRPSEEFVTDIVGDPRTISVPFIGDYAVETVTLPDCISCTGTVCMATEATVTWKSSGKTVFEKTLKPGESFTYNGRNDGSGVMVKFVSGQAAAQNCPGKGGMTGPQAVAVYVINVVPPVGALQNDIRTATTTRPDEALTPLPPMSAATAVSTSTKSGVALPAGVFGALAVIVLLSWRMRR
jgi:hypothetical protein